MLPPQCCSTSEYNTTKSKLHFIKTKKKAAFLSKRKNPDQPDSSALPPLQQVIFMKTIAAVVPDNKMIKHLYIADFNNLSDLFGKNNIIA